MNTTKQVMPQTNTLESDCLDNEARRVATCFGAKNFTKYNFETVSFYQGEIGSQWICWALDRRSGNLLLVELGDENEECFLSVAVDERKCDSAPGWVCQFGEKYRKEMAAGLFRLGFEDQKVLEQLNSPLMPEEQEKLRESLPRKYWPKEWRSAREMRRNQQALHLPRDSMPSQDLRFASERVVEQS